MNPYIYVASSWRNQKQAGVVEALREAGFRVYDFKNPSGETGFSWTEVDPRWKDWSPGEYIAALEHPAAEYGFRRDQEALEACDALVLVWPSGRSAHLEAGFAAGRWKPVYLLLEQGEESDLMVKMFDRVDPGYRHLFESLPGLVHALRSRFIR